MKNDTIIFIGRSASGKGTQIELFKKYINQKYSGLDILHYESGAHFRSFIKRDGYSNKLMRKIIVNGLLAPDFITEWLLTDELVRNLTSEKLLIIDGFPRTKDQAKTLTSAMEYYNRKNIKIINLEVSEQETKKRMEKRHRVDDKSSKIIDNRIKWHNDNVLQVLEYLRSNHHCQLVDINGEQSAENVHKSIIENLENIKC